MTKRKPKHPAIRDRIKDFRRVRGGDLRPNPKNWRTHPSNQRAALQGLLRQVGYAEAVLAREVDGGLELIDGHLRAELNPEAEIPVLVLDVTEAEADTLLATLDPLAALADTDQERLDALLETVSVDADDSLSELLRGPEIPATSAKPKVFVKPNPPAMTWALVGIPTVRYAEIAEQVVTIAAVPGVFCEVVANDQDG